MIFWTSFKMSFSNPFLKAIAAAAAVAAAPKVVEIAIKAVSTTSSSSLVNILVGLTGILPDGNVGDETETILESRESQELADFPSVPYAQTLTVGYVKPIYAPVAPKALSLSSEIEEEPLLLGSPDESQVPQEQKLALVIPPISEAVPLVSPQETRTPPAARLEDIRIVYESESRVWNPGSRAVSLLWGLFMLLGVFLLSCAGNWYQMLPSITWCCFLLVNSQNNDALVIDGPVSGPDLPVLPKNAWIRFRSIFRLICLNDPLEILDFEDPRRSKAPVLRLR